MLSYRIDVLINAIVKDVTLHSVLLTESVLSLNCSIIFVPIREQRVALRYL